MAAVVLAPGPDEGELDALELVRRAAAGEEEMRSLLQRSVASARGAGESWAAIGGVLGMSRQAAQQRFGNADDEQLGDDERWLGPVTAFDELGELELAGRMGWHTVGAGLLRHRMVRTGTQWEHRRIRWTRSLHEHEREGWQLGCRAFPWIYLVRDTGRPVETAD